MEDGNRNNNRWMLDIGEIKRILKSITIDKWLLIGAAGLVLVLCSDSCQGSEGLGETSKGEVESFDNSLGEMGNTSAVSSENMYYDTYMSTYTEKMEEELEEILSSIDGAGRVQVMITLKNTSTKEVLMEEPYSESNITESDGDGGSRDTNDKSQDYHVIYREGSDGTMMPFVVSELSPQVEGVAVVTEGGDSAVVKEKITGIIKALFGIEINKIAVGKMK